MRHLPPKMTPLKVKHLTDFHCMCTCQFQVLAITRDDGIAAIEGHLNDDGLVPTARDHGPSRLYSGVGKIPPLRRPA